MIKPARAATIISLLILPFAGSDGGSFPEDGAKVAVVELGEDRYAQVWIDPLSEDELQRLFVLAQGIGLE